MSVHWRAMALRWTRRYAPSRRPYHILLCAANKSSSLWIDELVWVAVPLDYRKDASRQGAPSCIRV